MTNETQERYQIAAQQRRSLERPMGKPESVENLPTYENPIRTATARVWYESDGWYALSYRGRSRFVSGPWLTQHCAELAGAGDYAAAHRWEEAVEEGESCGW